MIYDLVTRDLSGSGGQYNVPNGTPAAATTTLWIQGNPVTYDGNTTVFIEAYIAALEPDFHESILVNVFKDGNDLGCIIDTSTGGGSSDVTRDAVTGYGRTFDTPAAGPCTYSLRIYSTGGTTNYVYSGTNSTAITNFAPAYLLVSSG